VVTGTDIRIEDRVRAVLERDLGLAVVGEERGGGSSASDCYWLVDPICGTRNYASP
jgi:fructose-1,6-bisphosphatase/inositol monophosphatase family enzyme